MIFFPSFDIFAVLLLVIILGCCGQDGGEWSLYLILVLRNEAVVPWIALHGFLNLNSTATLVLLWKHITNLLL